MRGSFSRWEAEEKGKERRNASLKELECLRNLCCLEIEIDDCTLSAQEICLSQNLVKYYIRMGSYSKFRYYFNNRDYEKAMILNLAGPVGNWIRLLARTAQCLSLEGDGLDNINLSEMENLRFLKFWKCSTVKKLVDTKDGMVFPSLETLNLFKLESLEEICHLNQNVSFCNLKSIKISICVKLRSLFSVLVTKTSLLQLEVLSIKHCDAMEEVFWNEGTDKNTNGCIELPKLKKLKLESLPNLNSLSFLKDVSMFSNLKTIYIWFCYKLRSLFSVSAARTCLLQLELLDIRFCDAMEQVFDNTDGCIEFPKLKRLNLSNLPNLTAFFCQGLENIVVNFPNLTEIGMMELSKLNCLFPRKDVSFGNLRSIDIYECNKLRSLFSVSAARTCLLQLEVLHISSCDAMEQVFWNEGTGHNTDGCIEFPKLKQLKLYNLPNLTDFFCQGLENIVVNFPNLTKIHMIGLPKLNCLFPQKDVSFGNLISIDIFDCDKLRSLFSRSAARTCLLHLEYLEIVSCDSMEQVFWNEGTADNTDGCFEFPKLKELKLRYLPNLTAFCQGLENNVIKFPNQTKMKIEELPKLNSLSPLRDTCLP